MPAASYQRRFGMLYWIVRVCRTWGIPLGASFLSDRLLELAWALVEQRTWSLSARCHGPPECYAGLLSRSPLAQRSAVDKLKADWKALLSLELLRLTSRAADRLWQDIHCARNLPVRAMFVLSEAGRSEPGFPAGKHWSGPQCRQSTVLKCCLPGRWHMTLPPPCGLSW